MAEIQSQQLQQKHGGAQRCTKNPVRIDLTPMVDLGFLLITFFVFTTSLSKPKSFGLSLPSDKRTTDSMNVTGDKVLTLVFANENNVGYYYGGGQDKMRFTSYSTGGMRNVIIRKQEAVAKQYGDAQQLLVLIKPADASTYKNVVETLDEMLINNISRYMLLDLSPEEKQQIKSKNFAKQL